MKKERQVQLGTQFQKCFSLKEPSYFGREQKYFTHTLFHHRHVLKGQDLVKLIFIALLRTFLSETGFF